MKKPKFEIVAFVAVLIISSFFAYSCINDGQNWGGDFAAYITQAKSIAAGAPRGFMEASRFCVEKSDVPAWPIAYPLGYPALLSPLYYLLGFNVKALKGVGLVCYILFLLVVWRGFRERHQKFWHFFLLSFLALNPRLILFLNNITADVPLLLFSTITMVTLNEFMIRLKANNPALFSSCTLGCAIGLAALMRPAGLLLWAPLLAFQIASLKGFTKELIDRIKKEDRYVVLLRDRQYLAHLLIPYISCALVLACANWVVPMSGDLSDSYMRFFSIAAMKDRINYYFMLPSEFLAGLPHRHVLYGISIPFLVAGLMTRMKARIYEFVYVAMTLFLYLLWSTPSWIRYIFPIMPFMVSFAISGLEYAEEISTRMAGFKAKMLFRGAAIIIILSFCAFLWRTSHNETARRQDEEAGPFGATAKELFAFISTKTAENDVIIFAKPRVLHLMTERRSIRIMKKEHLHRGDYLCVKKDMHQTATKTQLSVKEIKEMITAGVLSLVAENSDFELYRIAMRENRSW